DGPGRVHQVPRRPGVVRAVESAALVFDERVHTVRVGARDGDADFADQAPGQTRVAGDLGPGLAAVRRFEEAAARSAARHLVLHAVGLPQRGEHDVRIPAIDLDVDAAGLDVAEQLALPRPAAIAALVDSALVARDRKSTRLN